MSSRNEITFWFCFALAVGTGVCIEVGIGALGHRHESWDSLFYWRVGLPLLMIAAFLFGFLGRRNPFAIGYAPFIGQFMAALIKTHAGSIVAPGLMFLAILGMAGVGSAAVGRALGERTMGPAT